MGGFFACFFSYSAIYSVIAEAISGFLVWNSVNKNIFFRFNLLYVSFWGEHHNPNHLETLETVLNLKSFSISNSLH